MIAFGMAAMAAILFVSPASWALDPPRDAHAKALLRLEQAEHDDEALQLRSALDGYDEALRLDPSMSKAMRAEKRAAAIRARSEGDLAPLAAFERVRRSPALSSDATAIDALVHASETFPPGLVRLEVWSFAAEAYAGRLGRPDDALPLWQRVVDDPTGDPVLARSALQSIATLQLARADLASAEAAARNVLADPKLARDVHRAVWRHRLHIASITVIALALALAVLAVVRGARAGRLQTILGRARSSTRLVLAYAAYVSIAGGLLASGYEEGTARPFLLLGAVLVPLLLVARAWGAAGSSAPRARGLRAALCATSALGAAFLVIEHVDVSYLEGLGL
jgi:hypothetical protein